MQGDHIYVLSSNVRLRNDGIKCLIYRVDDFFNAVDNITIIPSKTAVLLALFDGKKSLKDIAVLYTYLASLDQNEDDAIKHVKKVIKALEDNFKDKIIVEKKDDVYYPTYNPEEIIVQGDVEHSCPYDMRLSIPLSVNFNVSTVCGFNCIYCYHPLDPVFPYLSIERVRQLAKELKEGGCESVMLTGGDPFMRPDLIDVMKAFYDVGLFYSLSTKSILSRDVIKRMVTECGLDRIQLSFDSCKPEILSKMIGVKESYFYDFVKMVDILHEFNVDVRLKAVLTAFNCDELKTFLEFCHKRLGVNNIQVVQYGRSGTRHTEELFPSEKQLEEATNELNKFRSEYPNCIVQGGGFSIAYHECIELKENEPFFAHRSICNAGRFSLTILPNGEVTVCEQLPYNKKYIIGDLKNKSLNDFWSGDSITNWLTPPAREYYPIESACRTCDEDKYDLCHTRYSRCLRFIWETFGNTDQPDINCPECQFDRIRIT